MSLHESHADTVDFTDCTEYNFYKEVINEGKCIENYCWP